MVIGDRLKTLREAKNFSQGDIEKKTGLLRCYVSRVENGHTVPAVETLEKFARALELPLYHLMFDGDEPPTMPKSAKLGKAADSLESSRQGKVLMRKLVPLLAKMSQDDRNLILFMAGRVSKKRGTKAK
jgi:transcriptional regulator with XRE-family HTH domain